MRRDATTEQAACRAMARDGLRSRVDRRKGGADDQRGKRSSAPRGIGVLRGTQRLQDSSDSNVGILAAEERGTASRTRLRSSRIHTAKQQGEGAWGCAWLMRYAHRELEEDCIVHSSSIFVLISFFPFVNQKIEPRKNISAPASAFRAHGNVTPSRFGNAGCEHKLNHVHDFLCPLSHTRPRNDRNLSGMWLTVALDRLRPTLARTSMQRSSQAAPRGKRGKHQRPVKPVVTAWAPVATTTSGRGGSQGRNQAGRGSLSSMSREADPGLTPQQELSRKPDQSQQAEAVRLWR